MEYRLWIDGAWADSKGGGRTAIENPATGEKIADVVDASRDDVDRAVQAAHNAFYDGRLEDRPGLSRWLYRRPEARARDAAHLVDAGRTDRAGRHSGGCRQRDNRWQRHRSGPGRTSKSADGQPDRIDGHRQEDHES